MEVQIIDIFFFVYTLQVHKWIHQEKPKEPKEIFVSRASFIYIYGNFEGSKEGSYGETGSLERNLLLQGHLPLNRDQRKWYCNYCWELKKRGKKK